MITKTCEVVSFVTPDNYQLNGLLFGGQKTRAGFIFIHGLSSSAFSMHHVLLPIVGNTGCSLYFNNRGHDQIGKVRRLLPDTTKGYESELIGTTHEVFTECVDDISGAVNFLNDKGVKDIYLVGHSTGCQKSIYYLSRVGKQAKIKGVVLICPISDYSYATATEGPKKLKSGVAHARKLVKQGRPHVLLPEEISEELLDAQRYISLNTPDSAEEIFSYSQPDKTPMALQKVKIPILVLLAEADEYADRGAQEIGSWFERVSHSNNLVVSIVKDANHSFLDKGDQAAALIKAFVA